ncbi:carbohydrate binding family 9 domain-containing protein [Flavobacterium collinsii]|uniref:Carb-bd_dom_fam9 domain-containing protein n=1 Tax=Flavobacterium collinsii TaxID=1114861 RepID=A0A9W4TIU1_9FLAO|nr:carbohydrate binding family 9 domain-containing protein [Flavobacterium collinsii]CAI2766762.1 Carb-bd_dom_fam9 domain-containing protein [Flavobacterium collinsii]
MKKLVFISFLFFSFWGYAQKKILQAQLTKENILIDGKIDEPAWKNVTPASDFVMYQPDNGKPIPDNQKTEVRVLYNNDAIYIAALLYDDPNKVLKEISQRDNFGTADLFGVFINGFNDGQQNFQFFVSAADVQGDCIMTDANGEDYSWDAVWISKAVLNDKGWAVEIKIPYAALRFSGEDKQTWGINFFREIRRERKKYTWNLIDTKIGTFTQQNGNLEGIINIKPPTRLFFMPYASYYLNASDSQKTFATLKGGMDIKYGINDAFTLDAILIPDFGQTKYDDQILNLGPFEQQFNENRAFFTEGTDLFNKGNMFYSRRIGGKPSIEITLKDDEKIIEEVQNVNLINALKISGRTKKGLGIGILNAVTEQTFTTIQDTISGKTRREVAEPLTNYNVLVLDQRFRKNSSVTLINTNVTRNGHYRDANVTGLAWDLRTKANTYSLSGNVKYSLINNTEDKNGVFSTIRFAETTGNYRYSIGSDYVSKDFDPNDLGINFYTNYYNIYGNGNYRILNPTKVFNTFRVDYDMYTEFNKESGKVQENRISTEVKLSTLKNNFYGAGIDLFPLKSHDYYEPRAENRYVIIPRKIELWGSVSTNYNKKFALDLNPFVIFADEEGRMAYGVDAGPRYRFNDKLLMIYSFSFLRRNNNKGYIDDFDDDNIGSTPETIVFANRNVITYSNSLSGKYALNSAMTLNLAVRQYWSYAENKNILELQEDGTLTPYPQYTKNKNSSFYSWNTDLSYSWWFAPGSQLSVLYRNNGANFERIINKDFKHNIADLLNNQALKHIFSVSVKYFIDYNAVKNKIRKRA